MALLWLVQCSAAPTSVDPAEVSRQYNQQMWVQEHGLPDNRVRAVLQTRDGYLWIATQRGLARFDGTRFTVFDHRNAPELVNDDCFFLCEDRDGDLWIETTELAVRKRGNQFTVFPTQADLSASGLPCARMGGGVWAASDGRLSLVNEQEIKTYTGRGFPETRDSVRALAEDERGVPWLATFGGLLRFDPELERFEAAPLHTDFERLPAAGLWRGRDNRLWILFCNRVARPVIKGPKTWLACFKDGQWLRIPNLDCEDFEADHWAAFVVEDAFGALWLSAGNNGVHRFVNGQFQFLPMLHKVENETALCASSDREGNMWFGSEASGVQRWSPQTTRTYTVTDGLAHENAWSILEVRDGSVVVGTDGGVSRFKDGRFTSLIPRDGAAANDVRALAQDIDGAIWVGTMRSLLKVQDEHVLEQHFPGAWFETKVRVLCPAHDGGVWVGTVRGLTKLRGTERKKFTRADGLGSDEVRALLEDRSGDLWIGTYGGGLSRLHAGEFSTVTTTNGLSSNIVWALYEDAEGTLWVGTDCGLNRLKEGTITKITTAQGLPVETVNSILEDNHGRMWIGHDHGVYWVHKEQLDQVVSGSVASVRPVQYDGVDGLASAELNGQKSSPSACKTRDGRLWFATTKGVSVIDPTKVACDEVPPLTVVEQIRANGKVLFDNGPGSPSGAPAPTTGIRDAPSIAWQLAPGTARVLEFRYTANTFVRPERTRFRYRLIGLDEHWIEAGGRREAYFTDLRPGDYRFEVVACNHHRVWLEHGTMVAFHLAPFYYQTWTFYAGAGALTIALVTMVLTWRVGELRRIHRLEQTNALNEQRQQIARDIHDELGASLTHILQLSGEARKSIRQPERLEAQTSRIASVAEEAVDNIGEIIWANNPRYDTLDDLASYLREYAANFFAASDIAVHFDFPEMVPERVVGGLFRRHVLLLAKEALQNVLKHAAASDVCLVLTLRDKSLEIRIADNGRGLSANGPGVTGNGLSNMRQRAVELGGSLEVLSGPGQGTEIRVVIPWAADN